MESIPYFGETLAILTAITWAIAVILFKKSGETVQPLALNLFKNTLAVILFVPTIYIMGQTLAHPTSTQDYMLLLLSGALGIGISDSLFLAGLNRLGAGLTAIVDCLYSPFIIGLSIIWLNEVLTMWQLIGAIMIISAVLTVTSRKGRAQISRTDLIWGLTYGVLAMATTAVGIVMIKPILNRSPILWVTEMRLIGGLIVLVLILLIHPRRRRIIGSLGSSAGWKYTIGGSFIGAYVAMMFWLGGMKYTQASIAAALNQLANIFIFIFAFLILKEPINLQRTFGIILGVGGSLLVMFT
jgi:drug/metabolite transporter (DMT)-like permease